MAEPLPVDDDVALPLPLEDDDAVALEALKRGAQDYLVKGMGDAFILSRVVRWSSVASLMRWASPPES